jgi:2'-5' RNA ligase
VSELALVVPFDDLAPVVDELREQTCVTKPSHGMPPHVTLLASCPDDAAAIADVLAPFPAFPVRFAQVDRFPGTLWLAPEPAEPFVRMTETIVARFPGFPPYGGLYANVVPHLTVAQAGFDAAVRTAKAWLPLRSRADRAVLFEQAAAGRWVERARFELGGRS